MAKKKKRKKKAVYFERVGGRIHIRAASVQQVESFHAYARRNGMTLSALVVSMLTNCLNSEVADAEQV